MKLRTSATLTVVILLLAALAIVLAARSTPDSDVEVRPAAKAQDAARQAMHPERNTP